MSCRRMNKRGIPNINSQFLYGKIFQPGGMAERLKAHVLKTCLGHTNVGSNPTPSARRFTDCNVNRRVENGEVPEWSIGAAC